MREQPVTAEELQTIKNSLIQTFPSNFGSKAQAMGIFASDEYTRRDPSYWNTYRERIQAVTAADVQRVAQKHLAPEKMAVLVVGDQNEIDKGDPKHPVTLAALAPGGKVTTLPLRDPMTMKPTTAATARSRRRRRARSRSRRGRARGAEHPGSNRATPRGRGHEQHRPLRLRAELLLLVLLEGVHEVFQQQGLVALDAPLMKSIGPSWWRPFQTSRKSCAGPLK